MTEQQFIKFKEKITEFANKHKDELALIREDLVKTLTEINDKLDSEQESK